MNGGDTKLLAAGSDVLGGKHGSVGARLVTVGFDLHAAGDADKGLAAGEISHVDESIIEGGEKVSNAEDLLSLNGRGREHDFRLCGGGFTVMWWRRERDIR